MTSEVIEAIVNIAVFLSVNSSKMNEIFEFSRQNQYGNSSSFVFFHLTPLNCIFFARKFKYLISQVEIEVSEKLELN